MYNILFGKTWTNNIENESPFKLDSNIESITVKLTE